jgi:hypothetical protein
VEIGGVCHCISSLRKLQLIEAMNAVGVSELIGEHHERQEHESGRPIVSNRNKRGDIRTGSATDKRKNSSPRSEGHGNAM